MTEQTPGSGKTIPEYAKIASKTLVERVRGFFNESKVSHVVLRNPDGKKLFELNMLVAAIATLVLMLFAFWAVVIVAVIGYVMKFKIEVVREVNKSVNGKDKIDVIDL